MDIERSSTFTIMYAGRSLLTPSYFLLRWTNKDTRVATYCICTNIGNDAGPILLQVTETGAVTPDPFDAEVQLASVNYQLEVWEQISDSNLFPPETDSEYSELVDVKPADIPTPPPVDPCLGCGGSGDLCATVNAANSSDVIACVVENGDVPVYLCGFIATDEATADIGVECIGNAGKTADYQALLCPPCDPLSIAINGVAAFDVTDPCGNVYDIPIADSNGSIVPVTIVGDQVRVDDLPCAPCDPLSINVNGVEYGTVTDPCGGVAIVDVVNDLLAAVGSLVGGVWKIAKSRIYATDGVTLVQSIQPETNFSLPQSTIKYTDASNVAQVTAPSDTEFSTTLRPATLVPRRQILNTAGNPANSTFADLDDLISGTMPVAQDATVKTTDGATTVGTIPSNVTANLPGSRIKYKDESDSDAETASANTDYDSGSNTLRAATQIPRRELKNRNGTSMGVYATAGRLIADTVPNAPIPLKFAWAAGDADTYTWTVTDDEAGSYTTYTDDGGSGTVTYNKNGAGFSALSGTISLSVGDTIVLRRTTSTSNGWSKWA